MPNKFTEGLSRTVHKIGFGLKKHSPEIMVVGGCIGMVGATVLACKATTKASKIIENAKKELTVINDLAEHPEQYKDEYTKEDAKKDRAIVYSKTGLNLVKVYGPALALGTISLISILSSHKILKKRNVALAAAYTTVDKSFKEYRERVVERFGQELDKELKYNVQTKEVEEKVVDENGKEKTVKKKVTTAQPSGYARWFDESSSFWMNDAERNRWFIQSREAYANQRLKSEGFLFLNDVYDMLGLQKTAAGQTVGWIYEPSNPKCQSDDFVDFGVFKTGVYGNSDFVNGFEKTCLLDFNVAPILDYFDEEQFSHGRAIR